MPVGHDVYLCLEPASSSKTSNRAGVAGVVMGVMSDAQGRHASVKIGVHSDNGMSSAHSAQGLICEPSAQHVSGVYVTSSPCP